MNRIYIFESVDGITDAWHDDGGLIVITKTGDPIQVFRDANPNLDPDFANADEPITYQVPDEAEERIIVLPNAGCC